MHAGLLGPTFPQRSPPRLLTTAACVGLRSTSDCRPRRALLHLSYSCIPPCGPAILVTQDPQATFWLRRMIVSSQLFEAFLECSTKCWLRSRAEPTAGNIYAEWARAQSEAYY